MSNIIEPFESKRGRPQVYPWDEWTDGTARSLHRGEDFEASLTSMRTMIHRKARMIGMRAYTHIDEGTDSIEVVFYD